MAQGETGRIMWVLAIIVIVLAACVAIVLRNFLGSQRPFVIEKATRKPAPVRDQLTITCWNIGYAALSRNADYVTDGGANLRASDRKRIADNAANIAQIINNIRADIALIQENADASFMTRRVPVSRILGAGITQANATSIYDIYSDWTPPWLRLRHKKTTWSDYPATDTSALPLLTSDTRHGGFVAHRYSALIHRFPAPEGRDWVIVNLHLSAFDSGGELRKRQLRPLMDFAVSAFEDGNFVVMGGDWNLQLTQTHFPHTADAADLFWLQDFPTDALPAGWQIVIDPSTPTMRSMQQPYVAGENYLGIIDGFIASPNVQPAQVSTLDTEFEYTDHQPVTATFRVRGQ